MALRLALVPWIHDFDSDGYSRVLIAEDLAGALREGTASLRSLYVAVWPPAWAVVCATAQLAGFDSLYGAKCLSAVFGGLSPALAFGLAQRLGATRRAARLAWVLSATAPLQVLYATSAMSESFYGFWFLLAAYGLLRAERDNAWLLVAASALVPAALTRFDAWVLLPVLPVVALVQRRARPAVLVAASLIVCAPPLFWLGLNQAATGDLWHFTRVHGDYVRHFFEFHPLLADRGPMGIGIFLANVLGAQGGVMTLVGIATAARMRHRNGQALSALLFVSLAWLLALWLDHRQIGWRRHYLAVGSGLTVFAALAYEAMAVRRRRVLAAVFMLELLILGGISTWMALAPRRLQEAASFIAEREGVVYCDEPGVRVLSRLPRSRFVSYVGLPSGSEAALSHMRSQDVRWVVFADVDYSPLPARFPLLRTGRDAPPFHMVHALPRIRLLPQLFIYELRRE